MAWTVSAVAQGTECEIQGDQHSVLAVRVNGDGRTELLVGRPDAPLAWVVMNEVDGGAWHEASRRPAEVA